VFVLSVVVQAEAAHSSAASAISLFMGRNSAERC
jgi:hypothetical protein